MKAAIHIGSLQEDELRGNSELIQYHTKIDIHTIESACPK